MSYAFKSSLAILTSIITLTCFGQVNRDSGRIKQMVAVMDSIYTRINVDYVEKAPLKKIMRKGIDAMFDNLDPFTKFISKDEVADLRMSLSQKFGGTGMMLAPLGNEIIVTRTFDGYPANKAGILPGDKLLAVDEMRTAGKDFNEIRYKLMGAPGKPVKVILKRFRTNDTTNFDLVREEIKIKPVPYYGMVSPGIGYLQLTGETEDCSEYVKQALVDLEKNNKIKGLVLDLRFNTGGILSQAKRIANFFLDKGDVIVSVKGRENDNVELATENAIDNSTPLVILTNGSTISAAEIIAGAIQDNDRGLIIGQKTFGKGLVGQIFQLGDGSEAIMTIAFYYTPSGRCIQAKNYWKTPGIGLETTDSLKRVFKTRNGRLVREAEGIIPDLSVPGKKASGLVDFLENNLSIFEYAVGYVKKHPSIPAAKDFHLTDAEYDEFVNSVKEKMKEYSTETGENMMALKAKAVKEGYFGALESSFTSMEMALNDEKMRTFKKYRDEIQDMVEQEIVFLYYGEKGRKEAEARDDQELKKAIEVLSNVDLYHTLLKPHKL